MGPQWNSRVPAAQTHYYFLWVGHGRPTFFWGYDLHRQHVPIPEPLQRPALFSGGRALGDHWLGCHRVSCIPACGPCPLESFEPFWALVLKGSTENHAFGALWGIYHCETCSFGSLRRTCRSPPPPTPTNKITLGCNRVLTGSKVTTPFSSPSTVSHCMYPLLGSNSGPVRNRKKLIYGNLWTPSRVRHRLQKLTQLAVSRMLVGLRRTVKFNGPSLSSLPAQYPV